MRRAVQALVIVAAVGVLAGCGPNSDPEEGEVLSIVQMDKNIPCRVLITPRWGGPAITAVIEGCEAPKRADRLVPEVRK